MFISSMTALVLKRGVSWKWVVLWSLWAARLVRQPTVEVSVTSGSLRGSVSNNGGYLSYLSIPYATIPRRFQAPGPEPKWEGLFEAVNEHVYCTQKWFVGFIESGHEDCLILNVFTPIDAIPGANIPVMVLIHGGAFFAGSSQPFFYGPDYLLTKGVILVSFNYRLDMFGQLCLKTKEVPGNAAMKDQVAALRWVQRNIRAFGGDPDNVTIFGISAGAASVSYHILSPMSTGLFHKAILQSGSSLAPWALQYNPIDTASKLAESLGYVTKDPHEIYSIFVNKTAKELILAKIEREEGSFWFSTTHLSPCVETEFEGEEAFLTEFPITILRKGDYNKVPMIIGTTDEEGFCSLQFDKTYISQIKFEKCMPRDLKFPSRTDLKAAADKAKIMYMGEDSMSIENILKYSRFGGESQMTYPVVEETELYLRNNNKPIYNYVFNYDGRRNMGKFMVGKPVSSAAGASHADDLFYLFSQPWLPLREKEMVDRMTTLWTNFAKFGNPTPDGTLGFTWEPTNPQEPRSLVLGANTPETRPLWYSDTLLYWKELYSKYRRMGG